jgi:hypothetical protein
MLTDVQPESSLFPIQPSSESLVCANPYTLTVSHNASFPGLDCDACSRRLRLYASPLNPH